jgi:hypothetical protein
MTTHGNENTEGSIDPREDQEDLTLGQQISKMSMRMYGEFKEEGFSGKEAFELLKLWCGPNFAMIVQDMYAQRNAATHRSGPNLHIPQQRI